MKTRYLTRQGKYIELTDKEFFDYPFNSKLTKVESVKQTVIEDVKQTKVRRKDYNGK